MLKYLSYRENTIRIGATKYVHVRHNVLTSLLLIPFMSNVYNNAVR